jgi:Family of unknown function (DUF6212)
MNRNNPLQLRRSAGRDAIVTDQATSQTIYNGDLKVIIPAIDQQSLREILGGDSSTTIYTCERAGRHVPTEIYRAGVARGVAGLPLHHPPPFCLALIAASSAGKRQLEALRSAWSLGAEGFLPPVTFIDNTGGRDAAAAAVHRALFAAIAQTHGASATRLLTLQRQYAAFRAIHDQLQNAFDTVESFLARTQLAPTWLAFACEPTEAAVGPPNPDDPLEITQLLPLPSQGLAAVELHTVPAELAAEGSLRVRLVTCEDDRTLGEWAIPYQSVPDGWIFLDLPEIDIAPKQSVLLTTIWDTQAGTPPKLSLTSLQPVPESRIRIFGTNEQEQSVALRLHIGLPGSRRVVHPFHVGVMAQPNMRCLGRRLPTSVLRRIAELDPVPGSEPLVRLLEDSSAIELRPINGSPTVAKLRGALPAGARRLTATIRTEDPNGPFVEYALLALHSQGAYAHVLDEGYLNGDGGGFSGWLPIHPAFATQIHLNLPEPSTEPLDVYLAARLAAGQTADCAKAQWLELIVDAFGEPAAP